MYNQNREKERERKREREKEREREREKFGKIQGSVFSFSSRAADYK